MVAMRLPVSPTRPRTAPLDEHVGGPEASGLWSEVQHIQVSDLESRKDLVRRSLLIVIATGLLVYLSADWLYGLWGLAYLVVTIGYSRWLVSLREPVTRRTYIGLIAANMLSSTLYTAVPVYMWLYSANDALEALGICGMIGLAIYNLTRHGRYTVIALWDLSLVIAATTTIGTSLALTLETPSQKLVVAVGTVALVVFYYVSKIATIRAREALAASREELIEAQKQASMGQITAGVAHDFNNKLTAIQGNIELAALTHDPAERSDLLRAAQKATAQAADVVAHMQAFVRKSPLNVSQIDLSHFASDLQATAAPYLLETNTLRLDIDEAVAQLSCDPDLLELALLNLILNARDAMGQRGGQIDLRVAPGDLANWSGKTPAAEGPFVRFDVADEGPGLAVSDFNRVQEPFYTSKPAGKGTGLGLSMVKGFAEQIGGALMLRNRPTGGLEVSLILPTECRE